MQDEQLLMALQLTVNTQVTIGDRTIWAVPGDVILDVPNGTRKLLHKIDFEQLVEENGLAVGGDTGYGWVVCRRT